MPTPPFDHTLFIPNGDHEVPAGIEKTRSRHAR